MATTKTKILILCLLTLLIAVLLAYDVLFCSAGVWFRQKDDSVKLAELETALIKAASAGGIKREKSGKIKQTYTGKAPKSRPT